MQSEINLPVGILLNIIDHNAETKPKPFHMNKDLMKTILQIEAMNGTH